MELAETKAKLRRTRQELEEKTELVLEYKEEIEKCNATMQKLRHEVRGCVMSYHGDDTIVTSSLWQSRNLKGYICHMIF